MDKMIEQWIKQYNQLDESTQQKLEESFKALDLDEISRTYEKVYVNPEAIDMQRITEVPYTSKEELSNDAIKQLEDISYETVMDGQAAVLLMAGGQGTRLEYPRAKGTFSFDGVSLFELQSRQIKKYEMNGVLPVHWYIMTSDINHEETIEFFNEKEFFDLPKENVHFFKQEHFPPISKEKTLLLTAEQKIMMTPNGNGGIFSSLASSGMLDDLKSRGIKHVFMNNVDNVVVKVLDPVLLGVHIKDDNEVTSKSIVPKEGESVGRLSLVNGEKSVVEYTELPDGSEDKFKNGNIGIHVFSTDFLSKIAEADMPYHLALKKLEFLDEDLNASKDEVLKFEKFYFDAFKLAKKHHTLQVDRKGEFSPLKNKEGKDSIETAYTDLKNEGLI